MTTQDKENAEIIAAIQSDVLATSHYLGKRSLSSRVLDALAHVPRHRFVPLAQRHLSYGNFPLPIGHDQTISQPYIVAVMTDFLAITPRDRILEIGTGCGYQTAVLAQLAKEVFSIEIISELSRQADQVLRDLGYTNIHLRCGDGQFGWPEKAPFDGIMITAAAPRIAPELIAQLNVGGRLIGPVESTPGRQVLLEVVRTSQDQHATRETLPVVFVPMACAN